MGVVVVINTVGAIVSLMLLLEFMNFRNVNPVCYYSDMGD